MTPTTREIFRRFEVRKSKAQKRAFLNWLTPILQDAGYEVTLEKGSFGARNMVIGDLERAKVVFTAHYDTCAVMPLPNFITPKNPGIYFLYQILLCIPMFAVIGLLTWAFSRIDQGLMGLGYWIGFLGIMGLTLLGPANQHTANDNTSGITAIIDLAMTMPEACRGEAAFVLFDLEEVGLIGSSSFASRHKKLMQDKPLVNLDCVSDGETMLFVFRKKARDLMPLFQQIFVPTQTVQPDFASKGFIYPSDQANFPRGIGVASMNRTKGGMLYMDKIHTGKDRVYREENIAYLVDGCIRLTQML